MDYDLASHGHRGPLSLPLNQFYLPHTQYRLFDSNAGERPVDEFVIAKATWPDAQPLGARAVARETAGDQTLWVLPGEAADRLGRMGELLPEPATRLPDRAMHSEISLDDQRSSALQLCSGSSRLMPATLRHNGRGFAWPQTVFKEDGAIPGRVYLVYEWRDANGDAVVSPQRWSGEIPQTFSPGDSAHVAFAVDAAQGDGGPLEAGSYTLRLGLHQDGIGSFWEVGSDRPFDQPVEVLDC